MVMMPMPMRWGRTSTTKTFTLYYYFEFLDDSYNGLDLIYSFFQFYNQDVLPESKQNDDKRCCTHNSLEEAWQDRRLTTEDHGLLKYISELEHQEKMREERQHARERRLAAIKGAHATNIRALLATLRGLNANSS
jgi:hypothetical protein